MSDNRNSLMDAVGVLGTMAVGALIGAGVALLMAPKSGAELRADLKSGAEKVGGNLTEMGHKASESVRAQVEKLGQKAEELSKKAAELGERLSKQPGTAEGSEATEEA